MSSTKGIVSVHVGSTSEHIDSFTEASELSSTEGIVSVLVGSKWVSDSLASDLALLAIVDVEEIRWVGGTGEENLECGWV